MTSGQVNASFSLPEWQAVKMIFFAPCGDFRSRARQGKKASFTDVQFGTSTLKQACADFVFCFFRNS